MINYSKITIASLLLAFSSVAAASDCKKLNPESAVAKVVSEHGGKVLKVEETADSKGCKALKIRILVDGTIKAITIPTKPEA